MYKNMMPFFNDIILVLWYYKCKYGISRRIQEREVLLMKKLQVALLAIAASALVFTGCGGDEQEPVVGTDVVVETTVSEPTIETTETVIVEVDDTIPPEEGMVRSKLTNEWIPEELYDQRPVAVMTPNESSAIPHYALSNASIIYEANVEGRMTRMLAIYEDYASIEKIGNIRSLRDYYAYWAFEWDAVICHFGGPYYIDDVIAKSTTDNLNGNILSKPFFRSSDRKAPHNAYMDGTLVQEAMTNQKIEIKDRGLADETHYNFAMPSEPNTLSQYSYAEDATYINMTGCYPLTRCYFEYNEEDGLYYRSQYLSNGTDGPHIDGANGKQLTFSNIIIQSCEYAVRDQSGYLWFNTVDSGRDAWFATQGKLIKCTWEKDSEFGATRYYDEAGNEITFNTGKTMVLIIEDGTMFDYE